ncbi:hypothetical protein CEUSTIGMA_g12039.t1 [Chlamydomonas eustigma]|uniref:peptidylprolyl isomerase n=1 Tax=Chlamydomonas eustigma TaxID=1157962 RepID=A0A250XNH2_9CHLO|nr:hypothetical protein CEUSTIGMA_g12039.t1 [Chlamydomonas eustigma]|eukprot:GAX84618.1 hypothetical protein CEUSTIGMA_g12039.t1 [Chlamydomonas eustigma]
MEGADGPTDEKTVPVNADADLLIPKSDEAQSDADNFIPVTSDGGVLKKVLAEGHGKHPAPFSRCLVHYIGRIMGAKEGDVFMDTRAESQNQQPVFAVAGRESQPKEAGLSLALATMRVGEKAIVYIQDPKYGFGEQGNFSFPAVPPNAKLIYEVELVQWEEKPLDEGEDQERGLLYEERLERAERRRKQGNELFAQGKHQEALGKYSMSLSYLDEDFLMQLEGLYLDKAHEVKVPVHLNMAACQLQIEDYHTAIYNCSEVLTLQPGNVKALYRRGRARHMLSQTEEALKDLEDALKRSPKDAAVLGELSAVKASIKKERQAQAQLFRGKLPPATLGVSTSNDVTDTSCDGVKDKGPGTSSKARGEQQEGSSGGILPKNKKRFAGDSNAWEQGKDESIINSSLGWLWSWTGGWVMSAFTLILSVLVGRGNRSTIEHMRSTRT